MATNDTKAKKTAARAKPKANASTSAGAKATSSGAVKAPKANLTSSGTTAAAKAEPRVAAPKKPSPKAKAAPKAAEAPKPTAAKVPSKPVAPKAASPAKAPSSSGAVKAAAPAKAPSSPGAVKAAAPAKAPSSPGAVKAPIVDATPVEPVADAPLVAPAAARATSNGAAKAPIVEVTPVDEPTPIEKVITQPAAPKPAPAPVEPPRTKPDSVIDAWAKSRLDDSQRALLERIREIVKRVAPQATEAVKWAQPVWERNGPFAFLRPSKKHVTFGFWKGAEFPDPRGLLEGAGTRMRHLKIALGEKPPIEAITEFVREAVRRNETGGAKAPRR